MSKPLLDVLQGKVPERTPVWLMRQAGRYLPEYRELRVKAGNFLDLCLTPDYACEITLQPLRRFGFDAAILFADILLIPMALGRALEFREGEGPVLEKLQNDNELSYLIYDDRKLEPVFETLRRVKKELPSETALIGFCGAPWTVACYMLDGNSKGNFQLSQKLVSESPLFLQKLIDVLVDASEAYLSQQIEAGAEVLQIFDSWAGLLKGASFLRYVIEPTRLLVGRLKAKYPHIPIIGFPREAGHGYTDYVRLTGVDAMSIDQHVDLAFAKHDLQSIKPLQGNLDPALLVRGGSDMIEALSSILTTFGPRHIMNLGHGVVPGTPPEHVAELVTFIRNFDMGS